MGGGITFVEALVIGRNAIGIDLNSLAHFVATVKTTPLSDNDCALLREWTANVRASLQREVGTATDRVRNLPWRVQQLWVKLLALAARLPLERQRRFVRCALLKTGQWAIDCKEGLP